MCGYVVSTVPGPSAEEVGLVCKVNALMPAFSIVLKVTGYRCVPRVRARASGRAIPIQRNSTADTSCSEMFIYARARANHHSHLQRVCECGRSQVARQRPF